jgi:hypothetical protein
MVNLPEGRYRLIDNRIVCGESSWASVNQPITVCILHYKQSTPEHRALVKAMLDELNAGRQVRGVIAAASDVETPEAA